MLDSILVDWTQGSEFLRLVRNRTASKTCLRRGIDDPLEPLSEVWLGLNDEFVDGQTLEGEEVGRMLTIIDRRIANYFKSKGARAIEQLSLSHFDPPVDTAAITYVRSDLKPPHQVVIQQEQYGLIDAKLFEMTPRRSEAVRSRVGFPDALEWTEHVKAMGTTRQNVSKHLKRGLEELKPLIASLFSEAICVRRSNPGS
jgi:hypothetical protein